MKKGVGIGALAVVAAAIFAAAAGTKPAATGTKATSTATSAVERGKYLVAIGGCNDCHTPKKMTPDGPVPDMTQHLAGYVDRGKLAPAPAATMDPGTWMAHTNGELTAWAGPWGVSFAKNLTPDQNTGIGSWSEETFVKAIRTGKHMGVSRPILPPMPWQDYAQMTDADLKAVYAYLRTIPPIPNATPDPIPPAGPRP